jgi:FkbM family methyltransferase
VIDEILHRQVSNHLSCRLSHAYRFSYVGGVKQLVSTFARRMGFEVRRTQPIANHEEHKSASARTVPFFQLLKTLGFRPTHILDVGANHGNWTRDAITVFPNAHYTLVEPQGYLKANVEDLIRHGHKIHWITAGAGDVDGTARFTIAAHDHSSNFILTEAEAIQRGRKQIDVPMKTLNHIVSAGGLPVPEMVKIDAEGFDLKVLDGATALLGKTEVILIEVAICATEIPNTASEVINRMGQAGYRLMDITDLNRTPKDQALWLCEFAFISNNSALLNDLKSFE